MVDLDTREWLLTNGLGSFASGTVCDAHTRTYHGWLFAALEPPGMRTLLLSQIDATLIVDGQEFDLGVNYWGGGAIAPEGYRWLQSFQTEPVPTWVWATEPWQFSREILMPYGLLEPSSLKHPPLSENPPFLNRVLIRYRYEGQKSVFLRLRPLIGDRFLHSPQRETPELYFSQVMEPRRVVLQAKRGNWVGVPWQLDWSKGTYYADETWYRNYHYPEETRRGLGDREDLFSPGNLIVSLEPGETVILEARVRLPEIALSDAPPDPASFEQLLQQNQQRIEHLAYRSLPNGISKAENHLWQQLVKASDAFIVHRLSTNSPTVIAGYHWFSDWGRDTLIALPGLTLVTRRFAVAKGILQTFSFYCQDGLLPNTFPDNSTQPVYNSLDAVLWWIEVLGLYLEASQDWEFLKAQYPTVRRIYKALVAGTIYNIRLDAMDGLLTWDAPGVALTWMDAVVDGEPVTPRRGKPIEISALWYSALCWMADWAVRLQSLSPEPEFGNLVSQAQRYTQQADQVKASLQKYWNRNQGYFYDAIAPDDRLDASIRPNAVIALSLHHCGFSQAQGEQALQVVCDRLLTPYGLRSLDPAHPHYIGCYEGDMPHRDRSYHQGAVWSWLIGPFIRAWTRFYGDRPLPFSGQRLLEHLHHQACLGSISEIFDGDEPHTPKGAIAQAWSIAEIIRHWQCLKQEELLKPK